jgi:hypothetical protein
LVDSTEKFNEGIQEVLPSLTIVIRYLSLDIFKEEEVTWGLGLGCQPDAVGIRFLAPRYSFGLVPNCEAMYDPCELTNLSKSCYESESKHSQSNRE